MKIATALIVSSLLTPQAFAQCGGAQPLRVTMKNVELIVGPRVALDVRSFAGNAVASGATPLRLDRPASYSLAIDGAEVALSRESTEVLLADVLPGYLTRQSLVIANGMITHKSSFIGLGSFKISGPLVRDGDELVVDGEMPRPRWAVRRVLARTRDQAIHADDKDRVHIHPLRLLKHLLDTTGHLTSVVIEGDQIVERFGTAGAAPNGAAVEIRGAGAAASVGLTRDASAVLIDFGSQPRRVVLSDLATLAGSAAYTDCTARVMLP